jgi:hypothetical protein
MHPFLEWIIKKDYRSDLLSLQCMRRKSRNTNQS